MFHFPSTLQQGSIGTSRRSERSSLNATQQKQSTHHIFVKVEEELHDARRVHADGQEDDLRYALSMVIDRVNELSSMLSEAYKAQTELEIQLNVAKSNLKLVIANNEMLEDALKQNMSTTQSKDVGWNRTNPGSSSSSDSKAFPRTIPERAQSVDIQSSSPPSAQADPVFSPSSATAHSGPSASSSTHQDNRFFKFRFSTSAMTLSRPTTPSAQQSSNPNTSHLTSPSLPSLSSVKSKELEILTAELEKEKASRKKIKEEKAALEAELESLSQALFEEANKMVADERRLRAEMEEELKEVKTEKEALQSALRIVAGEDSTPHLNAEDRVDPATTVHTINYRGGVGGSSHSRTSSQVGIKSRPQSTELASLYPLPPSPSPHSDEPSWPTRSSSEETSPEENETLSAVLSNEQSHQSPRFQPISGTGEDGLFIDISPWADAVSSPPTSASRDTPTTPTFVRPEAR